MAITRIHQHPAAGLLHWRVDEPWWRSSIVAFEADTLQPAAFKPAPDDKVFVNGVKIRCPLCKWQPEQRTTWTCTAMGHPENFSGGCGHGWNTFDTAGLCPGCGHQWRHTTCFSCGKTTPHRDWYGGGSTSRGRDPPGRRR